MQAIDALMEEHDLLLSVLDALEAMAQLAEAGQGVDLRLSRLAVEFFRGFTDLCHHGKEERHLFPALAPHGLTPQQGPVAVMLSEHVQGREQVRLLEEALAAVEALAADGPARFAKTARSYIRLMRDHVDKENQVLFPMAAHLLSEEDQARLLAAFAELERDALGTTSYEQYLASAGVLVKHYGVAKMQRNSGDGAGN
jgi:hemerythrin-like domain-containing protein